MQQASAFSVIRPHFAAVLRLLLDAFDYAADCQSDSNQFAVELNLLSELGMSRVELRWLLKKGYAIHLHETTVPGAAERTFLPLAATDCTERTCLVLKTAGAEVFRNLAAAQLTETSPQQYRDRDTERPADDVVGQRDSGIDATNANDSGRIDNGARNETLKPRWDHDLRQLIFCDHLVKRFRVPAANQELILAVFEEEGWPAWIDDPLPPDSSIDPKQRLQATTKSLNRHQVRNLLRFHVNRNGQVVSWEPIPQQLQTSVNV